MKEPVFKSQRHRGSQRAAGIRQRNNNIQEKREQQLPRRNQSFMEADVTQTHTHTPAALQLSVHSDRIGEKGTSSDTSLSLVSWTLQLCESSAQILGKGH